MTRATPILFSGPMVRALLDGRKTQTRRLAWKGEEWEPGEQIWTPGGGSYTTEKPPARKPTPWLKMHRRFEEAGEGYRELLWCRETLKADSNDQGERWIAYAADDVLPHHGLIRWDWQRDIMPSIHMPKWASRLTLEVTGTKLERLQDISDKDAYAEGASCELEYAEGPAGPMAVGYGSAIPVFRDLWESLHGPGSWDRNDEVIALRFIVHQCNVADWKEAA